MAEQDTHASHFGGHPIPTGKVTERVSRWNLAGLGKLSCLLVNSIKDISIDGR